MDLPWTPGEQLAPHDRRPMRRSEDTPDQKQMLAGQGIRDFLSEEICDMC